MPKTEILVHITAPSRAADDTNYRALAAAYLAFAPITKTAVPFLDDPDSSLDAVDADRSGLPATQNTTDFLLSSQRATLESPDISFRGAADNLSSPDLRGARGSNRPGVEVQSSWQTPPSVIADSNPENNIAIPRYCSPTRILEHYLQDHEISQSEPSPSPGQPGQPGGVGGVVGPVCSQSEDTRETSFSHSAFNDSRILQYGTNDMPRVAVIPQSPLMTCRKRGRLATPTPVSSGTEAVISSSEAAERNSPIPASQDLAAHPPRADSEPPPSKRQKGSPAKENAKALARSSSDIGPRQEQAKVRRLDGLQRAHQSLDGLHIYSPAPPVSCDAVDQSTFVTGTLAKLAKDLDIEKRYQPKEQYRDIRPFERGHWLVDCTTWTEQLKDKAWGFLTNYVGNGVAGWGIWCCRDREFRWIRLYCWGSVVGHMHLVLYLASQRRILYTGSTWVGGNGQVAIVMGAKPTRTA
ncbi:hypothetical protein QBC33DRAFT_531957 [Phialemonium atrogriseum]|uniref:Uncharacterized protein n=1 Tax=Phialemonium atrogriseum TaxID=1093897 RepID=A0AAJ0C4H2_9PEZI|nr:uncharacterized protein QBC33DRAFT_531957 [Phialemonium atrogriseum]KAK1769780.1 hypothetical protein QBC33DRAFT_531957 [Phialemonium atrogriseum]